MATKSGAVRRKFSDVWDEIDYLYHKVLSWFYDRGNRAKALPYCRRLEALLPEADPEGQAILAEECRSLVAEVKGDLRDAIRFREHEIELIKELHRLTADSPEKEFARSGYDYEGLSDQLDLLAALYHEAGDLEKALAALR